jgi:hypothetical protein
MPASIINGETKVVTYVQKLSHSSGTGRHPLADRGEDSYQTPPQATRALMRAELLPKNIWEPACGQGAIVNVLREAGYTVLTSDIVRYDEFNPDFVQDFLTIKQTSPGVTMIVTNPPFKIAQEFIEHALTLVPHVAMFLRLLYLESETRAPFFNKGQLKRVHVFADRVPQMHRTDWAGPKANQAKAFAWFIFDADHTGPTIVDWIWADTAKQTRALGLATAA